MDVLLIGAGAVGQVFAHHLAAGGARVSFFVKAKHEEATRRGFRLEALHQKGRSSTLVPEAVYTSPAALAGQKFEQVYLCVSSTGLRGGHWLASLAPMLGDATIAAIQPGLDDVAFVEAQFPKKRIVWGMFPLVSFVEGGVTKYYLPPFTKVPWSGERAASVAEAFRRGGLPAKVVPDVHASLAFGSAVINLHMAALECAGWRLGALRKDKSLLTLLHASLREAFRIVAARQRAPIPFLLGRFRPWLTRVITFVAPRISPFAVEDYLRAHFSKVGDQTSAQLGAFLSAARVLNISTDNLAQLTDRLERTRRPT